MIMAPQRSQRHAARVWTCLLLACACCSVRAAASSPGACDPSTKRSFLFKMEFVNASPATKADEKAGGDTGAYFQKKLAELADHPLVGETRGVGMLGAIELVQDKAARAKFPGDMDVGGQCRNHCFREGLIMRAIGDTMVLSPPLVISQAEIDELFELARRCIDLTAKDLGVL